METHKKVVYLMKNIREGLLGFMMYKTHLGVSKYRRAKMECNRLHADNIEFKSHQS